MIHRRLTHEINLQYRIQEHSVNGIIHTLMDRNYDKALFLVPGIYGDRCDSRAMYVHLARRLSCAGYNVVRFDYVGGGTNLGNYGLNDFQFMTDTCVQFIQQVCAQFPWIRQLGMIGFSEGGKICVRAVGKTCLPVSYIGFCNAILVKEELLLPIKRPKLINEQFVYDSEFGAWTSFGIVEQYKNWLIGKDEFKANIVYAGVYSNDDPLTTASRSFLHQQRIPVSYISEGDHLFTSVPAFTKMIATWEKRISYDWPIVNTGQEHEYYIHYRTRRICVKAITSRSATKTLLYVHGLGQNKAGPSCLFTNMANELTTMNHVFFDFAGSGDSTGDIASMTLNRYLGQLSYMINYVEDLFAATNIILVGSGAGNAYLGMCSRAIGYKKIYFHPEEYYIWDLLSEEEKALDAIDTYSLFSKYGWAEAEFLKLGNIFNRASGFMANTDYLKSITHIKALKKIALGDRDAICVTNEEDTGSSNICVKDDSYLLMSAKLRGKVLQELKKIL